MCILQNQGKEKVREEWILLEDECFIFKRWSTKGRNQAGREVLLFSALYLAYVAISDDSLSGWVTHLEETIVVMVVLGSDPGCLVPEPWQDSEPGMV